MSLIHPNLKKPVRETKTSQNLATMPEDVSFVVASFVKTWAQFDDKRTEKDREDGIRLRDSTLRAVALTNSRSYQSWQNLLFENVTINPNDLIEIRNMLLRKPEVGSNVKTLRVFPPSKGRKETVSIFQNSSSGQAVLSSKNIGGGGANILDQFTSMIRNSAMNDAGNLFKVDVLRHFKRLETLIVRCEKFELVLEEEINGRWRPLSFFTDTLKRIQVDHNSELQMIFTARNAIWILCFSPHLRQAILSFTINDKDLIYLSEHSSYFKGKSNVKELAICPSFLKKRDGKAGGLNVSLAAHRKALGGSVRTEAITLFLQVTNQLVAFELCMPFNHEEKPLVELGPSCNSNCLFALASSFNTLQKLRLIKIKRKRTPDLPFDLKFFKNLKEFSLADEGLGMLFVGDRVSVPPSLQSLEIAFYPFQRAEAAEDCQEELYLHDVLFMAYLPNLKAVYVPSKVINEFAIEKTSLESKAFWEKNRKRLRTLKMFTSGKVQLKKTVPGEFSKSQEAHGRDLKRFFRQLITSPSLPLSTSSTAGESNCISCINWIYSFQT